MQGDFLSKFLLFCALEVRRRRGEYIYNRVIISGFGRFLCCSSYEFILRIWLRLF